MKPRITVIGSINMDLVTKTKRVPQRGETVLGDSFFTIPGGKGANQAVAAARLGAEVDFIGCVGDDSFGQELTKNLLNEGIKVEFIETIPVTSSGIASITLSEGDNSIMVVPGANYFLTPDIVEKNETVIAESNILLLQLEIPIESVSKAVSLAKKHNVKVILNPAPIQNLPIGLVSQIDYFTPNEHEKEQLFSSFEMTAKEKERLQRKCIITQGAKGVTIFHDSEKLIEGYKMQIVDTTGAGDTFNGAFAYSLSIGKNLEEACRFANAAAAISVTKLGAQGGMPNRKEVEKLLERDF
nr:ribokinase [Neobacillus terrae]